MRILLVLVLALLIPATGYSESIGLSTATLDWTGYTFSVSGTLVVDRIEGIQRFVTSNGNASNDDGFITLSADAHGFASDFPDIQRAALTISETFWLTGHGVGTLTISFPYTLTASCSHGATDGATAQSSVFLHTGPGAGSGRDHRETLNCVDGESRSGMLTVSQTLVNPTFGPLVSIWLTANTDAVATAPEIPSLALLPVGVVAVALARKRLKPYR